jgi:hypothetical protein
VFAVVVEHAENFVFVAAREIVPVFVSFSQRTEYSVQRMAYGVQQKSAFCDGDELAVVFDWRSWRGGVTVVENAEPDSFSINAYFGNPLLQLVEKCPL